jgi:glycosyltransferase involved in cell wall biosynthesis
VERCRPVEGKSNLSPSGDGVDVMVRLSGSRVLVIIPAYNEEESIARVIKGIKERASFADIVVINDGSADRTSAIARECGASVLDLPHNLGIGGAVQAGYKIADRLRYDIILRLDGDGQHDPQEIPRLLMPVLGDLTDVAFGSRFCGRGVTYEVPLARRLGIRLFATLVSLITGQRIYDATSGMLCANRKGIQCFARYYPQDYPEVESHVLLHKAGLRRMEVPVEMHPRMGGQSSIRLLASIYYAFKVLLAVLITGMQPLDSFRTD